VVSCPAHVENPPNTQAHTSPIASCASLAAPHLFVQRSQLWTGGTSHCFVALSSSRIGRAREQPSKRVIGCSTIGPLHPLRVSSASVFDSGQRLRTRGEPQEA
jgi:hypothetical protein